jgi:hypothetical protein
MTAPGMDRPSSPIELRHASTGRAIFVVVPERRLLAINGAGPRGAADFRLAAAILRTVAEIVRTSLPSDRRAGPTRQLLEITWPIDCGATVDEIVEALDDPRQRWRQLIELPRFATEDAAGRAIDEARRLGGRDIPLVQMIHVREGRAAQMLRTADEPPLVCVRRLLGLVLEAGCRPTGDLHELVLADPADVGRDRARSIVRVPIGSVAAPTAAPHAGSAD